MRHPHKRPGRKGTRERPWRTPISCGRIELPPPTEADAQRAQQAYEVMRAKLKGDRPTGGPPGLPVEGLVIFALVAVGAWLLWRDP